MHLHVWQGLVFKGRDGQRAIHHQPQLSPTQSFHLTFCKRKSFCISLCSATKPTGLEHIDRHRERCGQTLLSTSVLQPPAATDYTQQWSKKTTAEQHPNT